MANKRNKQLKKEWENKTWGNNPYGRYNNKDNIGYSKKRYEIRGNAYDVLDTNDFVGKQGSHIKTITKLKGFYETPVMEKTIWNRMEGKGRNKYNDVTRETRNYRTTNEFGDYKEVGKIRGEHSKVGRLNKPNYDEKFKITNGEFAYQPKQYRNVLDKQKARTTSIHNRYK